MNAKQAKKIRKFVREQVKAETQHILVNDSKKENVHGTVACTGYRSAYKAVKKSWSGLNGNQKNNALSKINFEDGALDQG